MNGGAIRTQVDRSIEALGAEVADKPREDLVRWIELVQAANKKIDLTAARTPEELVDLMIADALVLAPLIARGATVVDVGSGAGAPGLPLAILRDDLSVTMVEPLDKRVSFLRSTIGSVLAGRARLPRVVRDRGESLLGKQVFDVAISRATLPPAEWLALGRKLAPAGQTWVFLAQIADPEAGPAEVVGYTWPLTQAVRRAVRYAASSGSSEAE